jgi:CheY-like chemotaxis protein
MRRGGNGVEALAKTKRQTLNLAVLDLALPDTSGLELAKKLKDANPGLPIFAMTTEYNVGVEKKALCIRISAVFSKLDDLGSLVLMRGRFAGSIDPHGEGFQS